MKKRVYALATITISGTPFTFTVDSENDIDKLVECTQFRRRIDLSHEKEADQTIVWSNDSAVLVLRYDIEIENFTEYWHF